MEVRTLFEGKKITVLGLGLLGRGVRGAVVDARRIVGGLGRRGRRLLRRRRGGGLGGLRRLHVLGKCSEGKRGGGHRNETLHGDCSFEW